MTSPRASLGMEQPSTVGWVTKLTKNYRTNVGSARLINACPFSLFDFDGIAGASFEPVQLSLSQNVGIAAMGGSIDVAISYDMASMSDTADGEFRLWRVDANQSRTSDDLVYSGQTYSASDLGLSPGGSTTFYLEAVKASRATVSFDSIDVTVDVTGQWQGTLEDTIHARAVEPPAGNLTITTKDFIVTSEFDEDDPFETTIPSCGCEFSLAIDGVNNAATDGTLTLDYPSDTIEVRDLSGNVVESGTEIDPVTMSSFVVVGLTETLGGTIELNYAGRAGTQTLDSIAFNVPQRDFDIDLRVAAFIPLSKGVDAEFRGFLPDADELGALNVNWMREPGSVPNPGVFYGTNDRENPGDAGTSKIAVNAAINMTDIGSLEQVGDVFSVEGSTTYRALVNKDPGDIYWIDGRTVESNDQTPVTTETRQDLGADRSTVRIIATAGYPYTPALVTPNIDFDITFTLQVLADCSVDVSYQGWRNDFPAYEVMADDVVIHSYVAPGWDGPNPINLNAWTNISGSYIVQPSYLE